MERIIKYVIIMAALMTVEITITESKDEEKRKPKTERPNFLYPVFTNICDIVDRKSKVHCYCDSTRPKMATTADCWVFSGGIREDDPIWPSFSSQSRIEHLTFNVRSDDALTFIPAKALIRLDDLKNITIQFGSIASIPAYAFTNSSSVREIILRSNKISELEPHSFAHLMMLSNLSLDDNQLSELKRDVFYALPNLHLLQLSNNNLTIIHEGCFKHLNNLIELKLDSNFISVVTREMFEGLENLSKLDLRNNKLAMIGNLAFSDIWGLKELMLDNNIIEYISERSFNGVTQLRILTLSGNRLKTFYEDVLEEITSLIVLDLRDNLLETISYETVRPVIENKKSTSIALYIDGNPFICDCRLSWIYSLRNETRDSNLKKSLEKISCITSEIETESEKKVAAHEKTKENVLEYSYDYYDDKSDQNILYDEPSRRDSKSINALKLFDIPLNVLPCPKELIQSIEETYGQPVQNEIRQKSFSGSNRIHIDYADILLFVVMIL